MLCFIVELLNYLDVHPVRDLETTIEPEICIMPLCHTCNCKILSRPFESPQLNTPKSFSHLLLSLAVIIKFRSMDLSQQNTSQGHTREVDPNRLVERDLSLGYGKSSGFQAVTNLKISVAGYVSEEDQGLPVGFILNAHLEGFGNDDALQNHLKYVLLCATIHFLADLFKLVVFPLRYLFGFKVSFHDILVSLWDAKTGVDSAKTTKIMIRYVKRIPHYCAEPLNCLLLLWMARMEIDSNLKNLY